METAITEQPAKTPQRRTRWWLRGLVGLMLMIGSGVGVIYFAMYQARISLAEVEAEADRLDPDWRIEAILAKRRVIADKDNSALQVDVALVKGMGVNVSGLANYYPIFDSLTPPALLNFQQEQMIRTELGKIPKGIDEARKLREMPYGSYRIGISPDFISTTLPNHQNPRQVADWLRHDAYLLAHDEHMDLALESCQAIFNAARTMGDDPFLISHLIRIAVQAMGIDATERVLAQGEATEESLDQLQTLLAKEITESTWRHGARGERAGSHLLFQGLQNGTVNLRLLRGLTGVKSSGRASDWLHDTFPSSLLKFYPEHLQLLNRTVEVSKLPHHEQRKPLEEITNESESKGNVISNLLSVSNMKVFEADCRSQATLRATWVALACERYRLKHERWPETLDVLVQAKLIDAIPLDPYDGKQLRYVRTKEGITIYAVGPDMVDNHGKLNAPRTPAADFDLGISLWEVKLRRQAPPPLIAVPEVPK